MRQTLATARLQVLCVHLRGGEELRQYFAPQSEGITRSLCSALFLVSFSAIGFAQSPTAWDGFVTDTHCGTNCQRTSAMTPDKACVRRCVKAGPKYGLWHGKSVYVLEPQEQAAQFAAENVRVTGSMVDGTIRIQSIARIAEKAEPSQ